MHKRMGKENVNIEVAANGWLCSLSATSGLSANGWTGWSANDW